MIPRIVEAEHRSGHRVFVRFSHGPAGVVDLSDELEGPVFAPLLDEAYFAKLSLSETIHTIVWPNGADFSPEFLLARLEATRKTPSKRKAASRKRFLETVDTGR
jgi:hypothetical protein